MFKCYKIISYFYEIYHYYYYTLLLQNIIKDFKDIGNSKSLGEGILKTITLPIKGHIENFKNFARKLDVSPGKLALGLGVVAAAIAAIVVAYKAFKYVSEAPQRAAEKLQELQDECENTKSTISSINSELKTTSERIDELNAKQNLSLVEQEELTTLEQTNAALERQLALEEQRAKIQAREAANQADDTYDEWTKDRLFTSNDGAYNATNVDAIISDTFDDKEDIIRTVKKGRHDYVEDVFLNVNDNASNDDNINYLVAKYKSIQEMQELIIAEQEKLAEDGYTEDEVKEYDRLKYYAEVLDDSSIDTVGYIKSYADVMEDIVTAYENADAHGVYLAPYSTDKYNEAKKFLQEYLKLVSGATDIEGALNTIFNKAAFIGFKDALVEAGQTGSEALQELIDTSEDADKAESTALQNLITQRPELTNVLSGITGGTGRDVLTALIAQMPELTGELDKAGISAEQLVDYIMAIADPEALKIDIVKNQLKEKFVGDNDSRETVWDEFIANKPDDAIEVFYRYVNAEGIDLSDYVLEDLEAAYEQSQIVEESAPITLASLLKTKEEAPETFKEHVDKYTSELDQIKSARDTLSSADVDMEAIMALANDIPELAGHTDSLVEMQDVLNSLSLDRMKDFVYGYRNYISELTDETEINKAKEHLMSIVAPYAISTEFSRESIYENIGYAEDSNLKSVYNDVLDYVNFNNIIDKQTVATLSFDPDAATWTYEQWVEKIEAIKPQIELLLNESKMEKLQSEAELLESTLSLKEAKGIKPLVSDYRKLTSNSKEQVKILRQKNAELRKELNGLNPVSTEYANIKQSIDENVQAINEAYESQLEWNEAAENLDYEPNEGLMTYNKAKETRNAGDNYIDMLAAATEAQENREKGLIGTDDFKAVAEMFSPNAMDDVYNWDENYGKITRYFTEDEEGILNFLDDLTQKTNASGEALAVFDEETGSWAYNIDDIKASADALGISFEAFLAVMGRLQDYGFENNYFSSIEEGETRISNLYADLAKQEEKLHDLEIARSKGNETVTNTVLAAQEARVNSIKSQILESQDLLAQLSQKTAEEIETETRGNILSAIAALKEANKLEGVARQKQIADVYDSLEEMNINLDDLFTFDDTGEVSDILSEKLEEYEKIYRGSLDAIYKYADEDYLRIFDTVSAAVANPEPKIKASLESLAKYTQEQLDGITFNDGEYGKDVFGEAERTIDGLLNSLDLGQDQAKVLLEILGTLGVIDYEIELDATDIESTVANLTEEKTVPITYETTTSSVAANTEEFEAGISAAIEDGNEESATVSIDADDSLARKTVNTLIDAIENENPKIEVSVTEQQVRNTIQDALNKEPFKVEVSANASVSVNSGDSGASGTAHANGTFNSLKNSHAFGRACMMGDWGVKKSGRTLVGELGPEIVVNPATSRWYTVGDNGAEFVDLPQDAIVFNHIQSQALMDNGYVHGRGKALADGNAFANSNGFKPNIIVSSDDEESKASESLNNVASSSDEVSDAFQKLIDKLNDAKDWIEVDFSRLQSRIDLALAKSENEVGYKDKNEKVGDAQKLTATLLKDTRKGLKEYQKYAEKVAKESGISKSLKKKVQNGTIDIEQLSEKEKLQVEAYQTWYEKIIQCKQSIEELKKSQKELLQQKFDNIIARYDGIISHVTHAANLINNSVDLAEAKGYSQSASYYQTLYDNKVLEKNKKTAERDALQARLNEGVKNGTIEAPNGKKRGSEEWYTLQSEIYELDEGIQQADIDAQKFLNTMREISWTRFDEGHEAIKSVVDEADYLIDLMKNEDMYDDDGKVTEYGTATYGLHTTKLATHQQDIADYNAELAELEAALAEDPTNTILLERKQQVIQAIRESTKAYQDEKQAIIDLVKQGIEKQLSALKKLIDKYMDAIQSQKDLYDYQNNVKEQAEEIAKLQKRLAAYSGDNSEAGRLKREETEQALKEAQKQLEETQYDKYISDQQDMLDDLYEQYEEVLNDRLKDVGKLIENVQTEVSNQSENINKTLTTTAESVGTTLSTSMDTIWGENGSFTKNFNTAIGGIKEFLQKIYDKADENAENNTDPVEDPGEGTQAVRAGVKAIVSKGKEHSEKATDEEKAKHSDLWTYIVDTFGYTPTKGTTKALAKLLNVKVSKNITEKDKDAVYTALRKQLGDTDGKATFSEEFKAIIKTGKKRSKKLTKEEEKEKSKLWQYIVKNYGRQPTSGMFNKLGELFEVGKVSYPPTDKQKNKILKAMQARGYSSGTDETDNEWAWINENGREILTLPNGSIFMPFVEGTGVVNNAKTEEVLKLANNADAIMDMVNAGQRKLDNIRSAQNASAEASLIRAALTDAVGKNGNSGNESMTNNVTVNISLPSVTDGKSFLNWAQSNNGFERLIDSIVFAKMNGKSKLTKQRLKFNE